MKYYSCFLYGLIALVFCYPNNSLASTEVEFDRLLESTYQIRTKEPKVFTEKLAKLNDQNDKLSQQQRYYLKYLNAFNSAFRGQLETADRMCKELLSSNANPNIKFRAILTLLSSLAVSKNWSEGLEYLSNLLSILPSLTNDDRHLGYIVAAKTYNLYGQYQQSLNLLSNLENQALSKINQCKSSSLLIEAKLKLSQFVEFNPKINQSIESCAGAKENGWENFNRLYLAQFYIQNNKPTLALDILLIHLFDIEKYNYPRLTIETYSTIAHAFWLKGKMERAEEFALKAVNYVAGLETTKPVIEAYYLLYQIEKNKNNHKLALEYHEKYTFADQAYIDEVAAKNIAFQMAEHKETEQKQQIQFLNEKNKLLETEKQLIEAKESNNKLVVAILILVVLMLLIFIARSRINNRKLREVAERDVLTGVYNRGHFDQIAATLLAVFKKNSQDVSLVLFDLDYFKLINDRHGHAAGDWALQQTIETCRTIGRKNDLFARLGGEEFCILLPACDEHAALLLAEQCRKEIADINSEQSGHDFTITASFGVTSSNQSGYKLKDLLEHADKAMYKSKHNGRNRVALYTE